MDWSRIFLWSVAGCALGYLLAIADNRRARRR
jgi:hypothetical protein